MSNYVEELRLEIDRVTLKGNADKQTIRKLASIIFRMDQRIAKLEAGQGIVEVEQPVVAEAKVEEAPAPQRAAKKISAPKGAEKASTEEAQNP